MTSLVMLAICFFGILSYIALPVSDLPNVEYPTLTVTGSYPGATPDTMANNVAAPLERQFTTVDGINTMVSTSQTGSTTIVLQFTLDKSIDEAMTEVQAAITRALPNLPKDMPNNPTYKRNNPAQSPVLYYAIASDSATRGELFKYGYSYLGQRLGMVDGVSQVQVYGSPYAVRVQVDPDALSARQIGIDQVAEVVKQGNPMLATGALYGPGVEYTIDVDGQIPNAEGFNQLVVRNDKGSLVKISDLGNAIDSLQNDKYSLNYYSNSKEPMPCIIMGIQKQPQANTVAVIYNIKKLLDEMIHELPASVELINIFDQSKWIYEAVDDVKLTLLIAFVLVILVVLFYLGKLIDTIIPVVALPLSIIGTFCFMLIFNFSIDILSLLAITLSVGFLIDDAVVVLENIQRYIEKGESRMKAALLGSKEISLTILSMTLCLASVFIPMLFMEGIMGRIFREFAVTIIIAVLISGFISLSLTPLLCSRFIGANHKTKKRIIERISIKLNSSLLSGYERMLKVVLKHPVKTLFTGLFSLIATFWLATTLPRDFLPPDDLGFIQGFTQAQDGTSTYKMMDYQHEIAQLTALDSNVKDVVSLGALPYDNQGLLFIGLKERKERQSMQQTVAGLMQKYSDIVGLQSFLKPYPLIDLNVGTQTAKGDYQYTLQSFTTEELYKDAENMLTKMKALTSLSQVTSDMHIGQPQVRVHIDRDRASDLNVSAAAIEQAFALAYSGGRVSQINDPANQYYVIVETIPSAYKNPSLLDKLYITSQTSTIQTQENLIQIPLQSVCNIEQTSGPLLVNHLNTLPSVTITFDLDNTPLSTAMDSINEVAKTAIAPTTMTSVQGAANIFEASFKSLNFLFLVTIFIIYVILGILYENFIHPITVMSALPPAGLGALVTLILTGNPLSLYAFIGIIMLLGIVLKNGIMMVDFAIDAINEGKSPTDAIYYACTTRFRPILMTTFAAMMGAVPIALGIGGGTASSRTPLGLVIVGGLIFSQVLTLFLTPVLFLSLERLRKKI